MKQWLTIGVADSRVIGWQRSSIATEVPPDTADTLFKEATDADVTTLGILQAQSRADGRDGTVIYTNSVLSLPPDARPILRVSPDKTQVAVGPPDSVTFAISVVDANGNVVTAFNGSDVFRIDYAGRTRVIKVDFTNGVGTKVMTFDVSGDLLLRSSDRFKLESPVEITVYE